MNESEVRQSLLVRAHESPPAAPWTEADADAATREARREAGADDDERFVARRARIAAERIAQRVPAAARALAADRGWVAPLVLAVAFAAGAASDAIGPGQQVNLLAPPLLALLAWNLVVYALLVVRPRAPGPLRGLLSRALQPRSTGPALARYAADWARAGAPLHAARVAAMLHAAAAAFALGALVSMYTRGLALEYRASWQSTFLDADAVHALLSFVLGPASRLTGLALPDAAQIASLQAPAGENAARWIHLWATTVALVVLVPRAALAAFAAWRARRLASDLPLPLTEPYFARLLRARRGEAMALTLLPYGWQVSAEALPRLRQVLEQHFGAAVAPQLASTVQPGDEDKVTLPPGTTAVALFPLAATPERETHGRFIDALAARSASPLLVLVEESSFRRRFGAVRLAERRAAWERMLGEVGQSPLFANTNVA
jgi:hypothetical protein